MDELTFASIVERIALRQRVLAEHPFLRRLDRTTALDQVRCVAQRVAFFVLGFQDVIRLVRATTRDPELAEFARSNEAGDKGHDRWFLHDLKLLGVRCDVEWLFSDEHQVTRDVTYSQIADILSARSDQARFGVALALEATGAEFFERVLKALERIGAADGLIFFGRHHQQVEQSHDVFQPEYQRRLAQLRVPADEASEVLAAIERTFAGVESMASDIDAALLKLESGA